MKTLDCVDTGWVINTIREFCKANDGDGATGAILVSLGSEILGCSEDRFAELMDEAEKAKSQESRKGA